MQSQHKHDFGQGLKKSAEQRTILVTALTLATMVAEVLGGVWTGSMALLADGIHMAGHALALGLAAGAYYLARRHAHDRRLSLGSGKIGDLAAYTSALMLGGGTIWLVVESVQRLLHPGAIHLTEAMIVALIGLGVNLLSAWLLSGRHEHLLHDHHDPHQDHEPHFHQHEEHQQDHNLKAALVHVMADALTSVAAIVGLGAASIWGWLWLDPVVALLASVVILRWAIGLLRQTTAILLDSEGPGEIRSLVRQRLESVADSRLTDLHLWSVGQNAWTVMASVVTHTKVSPESYKEQLADLPSIHHPVIEVYQCDVCPATQTPGAEEGCLPHPQGGPSPQCS
ncbi:MAG: cation transporter [Desulfobulbaceae bacterium A2]|nr:MAG: cation transporter [Desulfobulbaceae bacterium A2]